MAERKFHPKFLEVVPISSILTDFCSHCLLLGDHHKANIDTLDTQKRKAVDYIIKPGLKVCYTGQIDKMLKSMMILLISL